MAKAPQVDLSKLPDGTAMKLVGNGMSVPCAGALILIAALFVEKKSRP